MARESAPARRTADCSLTMPIFDVPPSPPSSPAESPAEAPADSPRGSSRPPQPPPPRRKRGDYEGMESHELLAVIDDLEDERSRLRRREGIWVSVLAHVLLFLGLAFLPKYFPRVEVRNPSDEIKAHERDLTRLTLPPNALKSLRTPPTSPRSQPAPVPAPKALEAPPTPKPVTPPPPTPRQQPQQQPPQQTQQLPTPPMPTVPQSQVEAPRQAPPKPSFSSGQTAPGDAVREAARAAAKGGLQSGGGSLGAPGRGHSAGLQAGAQILTDTGGWNSDPYIRRVVYDTHQAWDPIIPEEVNAPLLKKGMVGIRFKIYRDGSVHDMHLESPSGDVALDKASWGGIVGASYPPLPAEFKGPFLELRFGFFYNEGEGLR